MQEACCVYKRIRAELNWQPLGAMPCSIQPVCIKVWQVQGVLVACVAPVCYLTVT